MKGVTEVYEMRPFGRGIIPFRFAALAIGSVLLLFFGLAVLTPLHFFPFFPLVWVAPLLAMRLMWMAPARSRTLTPGGQPEISGEDRKEKELLEALERRGEITPARAALETSLSVAEADERLSRLAENGHVQVHAREGRLAYSLWDMDRRGEIEGSNT
jgi:membrane protein implicated in regulation of membrane protease activity